MRTPYRIDDFQQTYFVVPSLQALLDGVRQAGEPVAVDALVPSTLVLPHPEASLHEVRDLLSGDGLIPG